MRPLRLTSITSEAIAGALSQGRAWQSSCCLVATAIDQDSLETLDEAKNATSTQRWGQQALT
jgi:hypothetical protein